MPDQLVLKALSNSAGMLWVFMTIVFLLALWRRNNSFADIAWGLGFVMVVVFTFDFDVHPDARSLLVSGLVAVWGLRLFLYIGKRNWGRGEDFRYAKWRREWGKWLVPRSFVQIFMLQGMLLLLISYPVVLINSSLVSDLSVWDFLGILIWLTGFVFEVVADFQMARFKSVPEHKGRIMTRGLWSWTRHPNYFGEATMWWGIACFAVNVKGGWTAFLSPLVITFLLLKVSGIPMLEKKYAGNPEFQVYAQKTPVFFPRPPKKS